MTPTVAPQAQPGALIVGGHFLSLGAARNLAQAGVPVAVVDSGPCVSQFSRQVRRCYKSLADGSPCPPLAEWTASQAGLVDFLLRLAGEADLAGWVLFASTDEAVKALALGRDRLLARYHSTTPDWETVQHFYDKRLTHRLALTQNVPAPATVNPADRAELAGLALEFPLVLKPAISTRFSAATKKKALRADDRRALLALYDQMAAIIDPAEILVQELIPGRAANLYSYFGLFQAGRPLAGFSAHRPRQHPMEFGRASTLVVTVRLPELEELATRLLSGVAYSGLAEVEFMFDPRRQRFELLEVNPRLWGWHTIAAQAGVNLPYLAYAQALGLPLPADPARFREGVTWVRLVTDIPTALGELRRGNLGVGQYVRSLAGSKDAVFSWHDPLPFFMELLLLPYYARHRGF